jgi:hypothetical protein
LIRSRWAGHSINAQAETAVFILLVRDPAALDNRCRSPLTLSGAAWGMAIVRAN